MNRYEYGWSAHQRQQDPKTVEARNVDEARRTIRARHNLRTTRGISLVTAEFAAEERARAARLAERRAAAAEARTESMRQQIRRYHPEPKEEA